MNTNHNFIKRAALLARNSLLRAPRFQLSAFSVSAFVLLALALVPGAQAASYWMDQNTTTSGFGMVNGTTYDWTSGTPWTKDKLDAFSPVGVAWPGGANDQ